MDAWTPCPFAADYVFDIVRVRSLWTELHAVDDEALPDDEALLRGWALFHSGRFQQAAEAGNALGLNGWSLANRATAAHAALVEPQESVRLDLFKRVHLQAAAQAVQRPQLANAWYWQGYALARYAQGIHVARALAQGLGTQVRAALRATLALDPNHAYAHVALGTFEAAVIDKLGPMVGAMTYGVTAESALQHLRDAQRLAPDSPAVLHECANALLLLDGRARLEEATRLQEAAARVTPRDAVERLWVELARTSLTL
jgi:tetratricopeptide (TPR) repeat protein